MFDDLLFDFCGRIVDHDVDVVLLAGQPSKLGYLQELVRMYVPLPASRIIPMFNHYAGNWYPYQDVKGHAPGLIVDPKSAVVVGAAIEFLARHGMLPQFKFAMRGKETENTYFWGVMTESTSSIREERILFGPVEDDTRDEWTEFTTIAQRVVIGRKMVGDPDAQASPIYALKMDVGNRIGPTNVTVKIKRAAGDGIAWPNTSKWNRCRAPSPVSRRCWAKTCCSTGGRSPTSGTSSTRAVSTTSTSSTARLRVKLVAEVARLSKPGEICGTLANSATVESPMELSQTKSITSLPFEFAAHVFPIP